MSNKVLSFLILFVIFWWIIWGYLYLFVYYTWNLVLSWNQWDFSVKFYSNSIKRTIETKCEKNICEIDKLPPLTFKYTVSKKWFKDFVWEVKIPRNSKINATFLLKKETVLVPLEKKVENNNKNKIEELRTLWKIKESFKYFDMWDDWIFYLEENNSNLALYNSLSWSVTKIYDIAKVSKEELSISYVEWIKNQILIEAWENKYIYDIALWKVYEFSISIPLKYIKSVDLAWNYQIVSEKWTFLYSIKNPNLEYFSMFSDFVFYDNNSYIWIIYSGEEDKKKNYSISGNWNIVLYYNYISKEKKILMETSMNISKIVKENDNIYAYDSEWKSYLLKVWE